MFRRVNWPVRYIGDQVRYADFVIELPGVPYLLIEVKPDASFISAATVRAGDVGVEELLVICDNPGFSQWWYCTPTGMIDWHCREVMRRSDCRQFVDELRGAS
jgi:hypothetical protein